LCASVAFIGLPRPLLEPFTQRQES